MNFFDYCRSKKNDLKRSLENRIETSVLDIDLEDIDDHFILFVSTRKGNNRVLMEMSGNVKIYDGNIAEYINELLLDEINKFTSNMLH